MDRTTLADELRTARFRTTQFRQGYDEGAVDDLIEALVRRLLSGDGDREIVAVVDACRFPTTSARRGYDMADVDAALERVTTALGGAATPAAPLPSAVTEPPRGFLARLLGR
jgi:DivIVA domain-containing protein